MERISFSGRCGVTFCCKRGHVWWITTACIHNFWLLGAGFASGQSRNVLMGSVTLLGGFLSLPFATEQAARANRVWWEGPKRL